MKQLVAPVSVLRVAAGIDSRQAASLDAIAFSANVIDYQYRRLSQKLILQGGNPAEDAFADAWGMIDWIHRIDRLVSDCRGLPKRAESVRDFRNSSSLVENLRHQVQHPEGTIPTVEKSGRSPWGHLSWVVPNQDGSMTQGIAIPSLRGQGDPAEFVATYPPSAPRGPIDYISLFSANGEYEISLTGQHQALVRFVGRLEEGVMKALAAPRAGIARIPMDRP